MSMLVSILAIWALPAPNEASPRFTGPPTTLAHVGGGFDLDDGSEGQLGDGNC